MSLKTSSVITKSWFLSKQSSKLLDNGSLEATLFISKITCYLLFKPWSESLNVYGRCIEKHEKDYKSKLELIQPPPPINLITTPHNSKDLPVYKFLKLIPSNIKNIIGEYYYNQISLLQVCSKSSVAINVLINNSNLLWLWVSYSILKEITLSKELINNALSKEPSVILSTITKRKMFPSDIEFLNKIEISEGNKQEYEIIINTFINYTNFDTFINFDRIPIYLLSYIDINFDISKMLFLTDIVSSTAPKLLKKLKLEKSKLLIEYILLLDPSNSHDLKQCTSFESLNSIYNKLCITYLDKIKHNNSKIL